MFLNRIKGFDSHGEGRKMIMKKTLFALTALTATVCMSASAFADTYSFSDITESRYSWCAPQIEEMYDAGYITGYEDGTFRPDNQVTKLEGIALFARSMGSGEDANAELLELAHSQYDSALSTCGLSWGQDELAYMLYKGAFTNADLTTYITGTTKNQPLTRGEAAVIITKAMGGESKATSSSSVSLDYSDARTISANIRQYVAFVTEEGIMNGMDDGSFSPDGTVTRSQIAVMLARAVEACDYTFERVRVTEVDEEASMITLSGSNEQTYEVTNDTNLYIKGESAQISDIPDNVSAVAQFSGDSLFSLDALSDESDTEITAVFKGYNTVGGVIQVRVTVGNSSTVSTYTCIADVPITYQGSPATIKSFKNGDSIVLEVSDGKVQSITGGGKSETISNATITAIDIGETDLTITISSGNDEYDGKTYTVASDVSVTKNSSASDMASVYVGDKVTLTLEYGVVTKVAATSSVNTVSGILKSVTIAAQPEITITVEGKDQTYQVPQDCIVTINEQEGSLYDFRVGDSLVLTVQSDAVTRIRCSTSTITTTGRVYGTVTAINTSYGFISVMAEDSEVPVTIFCRDNNTTFIDEKGSSLKMNSINAGDIVECRGATTNGAFVATLVIVTPASN